MRKLVASLIIGGAALLPFAASAPAHAAPPSNRPPTHCGGLGKNPCPPPEAPCALGLVLGSMDICILP